jgi:hypothetical protein
MNIQDGLFCVGRGQSQTMIAPAAGMAGSRRPCEQLDSTTTTARSTQKSEEREAALVSPALAA